MINENEQTEQIQNPVNYQTPLNNYGNSILYLTNPESVIQELVLTLENKIRNEKGDIIIMGNPLINKEGLNMIVGHTRSLTNQVTVMSNLEENEIIRLVMRLADTVIKDLMINKKKYEIKDDASRSAIVDSVTAFCYVTMKRAIAGAGNEKKFWGGSIQEINYNNAPQKNTKSGVWNQLANWG